MGKSGPARCGRGLLRFVAKRGAFHQNQEDDMTPTHHSVTFLGNPLTLTGNGAKVPAVGDKAPAFSVTDNDLKPVGLNNFSGQTLLIAAVPSLDTDVCSIEAKRFNDEAATLGEDVVVATISMDLPFAQKRWAKEHEATRLTLLSDHRGASFGQAYGVLVQELRLLARSVFVIDRKGVIRHVQVVPEMTNEPDYAAALAAARAAMK
jgi:thiol peroxidase